MARESLGGGSANGAGAGTSSSSTNTGTSSNIRVSVRWYEQTVFAGDELRCRITFANVAPKPRPPSPPPSQKQLLSPATKPPYPPSASATRRPLARSPSGSHLSNPSASSVLSSMSSSSLLSSSPANLAPPPALARRHNSSNQHQRASHSISGPVPSSSSAAGLSTSPSSPSSSLQKAAVVTAAGNDSSNNNKPRGKPPGAGHGHHRSLSIVSISADSQLGSPGRSPLLSSSPSPGVGAQLRPARGHSRATSLQVGRGGSSFFGGGGGSGGGIGLGIGSGGGTSPRSATANVQRSFSSQPSPLFNASFPHPQILSGLRGRLTGSATMPNTPTAAAAGSMVRSPSEGFPDFKFPAAPAPVPAPPATAPLDSASFGFSTSPTDNTAAAPTTTAAAPVPTIYEGPAVVPAAAEARILATTSIAGTPRSSGEFYSLSNHSTETMASEYVAQQPPTTGAAALRSPHARSSSAARSQQQQHQLPPHVRQKSSQQLLSPAMVQPQSPNQGRQQQQQQKPPSQASLFLQPQRPRQPSLSLRARTAAAVAVAPETLMMGYAHVQGSFTLDGSLVDLHPFEQVKRKAVVGGQGGGVIGLDPMSNNNNATNGNGSGGKRDSMGLLRGFGWGSLASSLGDLLGGGDLSTIKEMRDLASAKAVPLLSTPQSVLFVDLQLAPGESKTYEYTFQLPKGLPPTHRGKVMKIAYGLVIGTQRPGTAKEQRVKSIEIPFRVLGSVNSYGEILGHDLMTPYILKQDRAVVQALSDKERSRPWTTEAAASSVPPHHQQQEAGTEKPKRRRSSTAATISASGVNEFTNYVDELLRQQEEQRQLQLQKLSEAEEIKRRGLLSPTATLSGGASRRASASSSVFWGGGGNNNGGAGAPGRPILSLSSREAIDLAILRSNMADHHHDHGGTVSNNRFDIARNGRRVGTVMLARPAYRLGETVTMVVDFASADPDMRCYAVHAALETAERVIDASLALRSEASIQRVTRKVYASLSEVTLYARRFVFAATIPASATPEFVTTGVNLEWKIKIEFVVPGESSVAAAAVSRAPPRGLSAGDDEPDTSDDGTTSRQKDASSVSDSTAATISPATQVPPPPPPLMEEAVHDERGGLILMAAETLRCESFEVAVPLRVYGWSGEVGGVSSEREAHIV